MGCIYFVKNTINDKRYIGKTMLTMEKRKIKHLSSAKKGSRYPFHKAIRKYGNEAFSWTVMWESDDEAALLDFEVKMILLLGTRLHQHGYNVTEGGEGVSGHSHEVSQHVRDKISATMKGKAPLHIGPAAIAKMVATKTGRKFGKRPKEWVDNMRAGQQRRIAAGGWKNSSRNKKNNRLLTYNDETLCLAAWSDKSGLSTCTIRRRINAGWSIEAALTTPSRTKKRRRIPA